MPMRDVDLVLRAAAFAADKHRDQRRKDKARTPYINHPLAVARALSEEGGVRDPEVLAAALLHDTLEDTETTRRELGRRFGRRIAGLVAEVTDDKSLPKQLRKRLQVAHARTASRDAQQIKLADKLCNLRDMAIRPPARWSAARRRRYFEWARNVVQQIRSANPRLAWRFDAAFRAGRIYTAFRRKP